MAISPPPPPPHSRCHTGSPAPSSAVPFGDGAKTEGTPAAHAGEGTEPPDPALRGLSLRGAPEQPRAGGKRNLSPSLRGSSSPPLPRRLAGELLPAVRLFPGEAVPSGAAAAHSLPFLPREGSFTGLGSGRRAQASGEGACPTRDGTRGGEVTSPPTPGAPTLHKPNYPKNLPVPPDQAISFIRYVEINIHYDHWLHLKL